MFYGIPRAKLVPIKTEKSVVSETKTVEPCSNKLQDESLNIVTGINVKEKVKQFENKSQLNNCSNQMKVIGDKKLIEKLRTGSSLSCTATSDDNSNNKPEIDLKASFKENTELSTIKSTGNIWLF